MEFLHHYEYVFADFNYILNAACYLIESLHDGSSFVVYNLSISLLLKALSLVLTLSKDFEAMVEDRCSSVFKLLKETLMKWIDDVVGGDMFGETCKNNTLSKPQKELEVSMYNVVLFLFVTKLWECVFSIECPDNLGHKWKNIPLSILKARLSKVR